MTILEFTTNQGKFVGRVTDESGKLEGNTEAVKNLLTDLRARGTSDEAFIEKFDGYNNGYLRAKVVPE